MTTYYIYYLDYMYRTSYGIQYYNELFKCRTTFYHNILFLLRVLKKLQMSVSKSSQPLF